MSDMPNSNRNWKGRYFFVQGTDYVCRLEEWATMPHGFDNTWGIVKDSSLTPSIFALTFSIYLISVLMLFFSFFNYSNIIDEQEAFIHRILEISFEQQKCRDLITLDTLHAYCGGPKLTPIARRLNTYSHRHKYYLISPVVFLFVVSWSNTRHLSFTEIEATRQGAQVRATAASKKEEEKKVKGKKGASSSTPKVVKKGALKRKADGKDDHPPKKVFVTPWDKLPKKPSPPKQSHRASKGLMTTPGPITQGPDRHLFTHKDYAVGMIESIIKDKDVDPCAEQMTEELGASGLFELAQVHLFLFSFFFIYSLLNS